MIFPSSKPAILSALLLSSTFTPSQVHGCANNYLDGLDKWLNTKSTSSTEVKTKLLKAPPKDYWIKREKEMRAALSKNSDDYQAISDLAVCQMHLGDAADAVKTLTTLVKLHPEEYNLAANLGTAYELNGEPEKALLWINRAIEINPSSHQGTEWLHVKILEAKLAMKQDPTYLRDHSILGMRFGAEKDVLVPHSIVAEPESLGRAYDALTYQLHERLQFVAPPDPVVADLLFDLGNVASIYLKHGSAWPLYKMSLEYGTLREEIIGKRAPFYVRAAFAAGIDSQWVSHLPMYAWAGGGVMLLGGGYLWKRRKMAPITAG
ncbi:MAG: tetratricopeptide repeat protein [Verrucomicrobiales bacterium]